MFTVLEAVIPITALIAFGWWLKQRFLPEQNFWRSLDQLVYYGAFPALLLRTFTRVNWGEIEVLPLAAALISAVVIAMALLVLVRKRLMIDGPGFTSVVQGALRYNSYIGLAIASSLYGEAGMTMFAIVIGIVTPVVNTLVIVMLERYGTNKRGNLKDAVVTISKNPLIVSILIGIALAWTGIGLPWALDPFAEILGRIALPLGVLSVGAGLDFSSLKNGRQPLIFASLGRLVGMPLIALLTCAIFGVEGLTRTAILIYACLPCSPASYTLARQLKGDAILMANIITVTSILSLLATPFWLGLFGT
jgi:predicted permease